MLTVHCADIHHKKELNLSINIALGNRVPVKCLNSIKDKLKYPIIYHNCLKVPTQWFKHPEVHNIPVSYERFKQYSMKFDIHVVAVTPPPTPNLIDRHAVHLHPTPSEHIDTIYEILIHLNNGSKIFSIAMEKENSQNVLTR